MALTPQGNSAKVIMDFVLLSAARIENSGGVPLYMGYAEAGTNGSATGWSICKMTYDAEGIPSGRLWAEGTPEFDKVWDLRTGSYTYK